ncbi:MAG: metallopeptidase, partial [Clostridia bacterium]|nr:metallopeptidase [Clostridia bacterium]
KGFGGTDFRPVFNHIDKLINQKEFTNLKGLIYFTDGAGSFPQTKPKYETAFVFVEGEEYTEHGVPSWAMKVVLRESDIKEL